MTIENYYSKSMPAKSEVELLEYVNHYADYQVEAVLAALCELEKRRILTDNASALRAKLSNQNTSEQRQEESLTKDSVALYSPNFIIFFGILFSVLGAGILVALNFMQLKKVKTARMFLFAGLGYSLLQMLVFSTFKTTSPLISVASSLLGVYLLNYYSAKEMPKDLKSTPRNIWNPVMIAILILLPLAFFVIKTSGVQ